MWKVMKDKKFGVINISKSGTTTETALAFRLLKKQCEDQRGKEMAKKVIVAVTDAKKGAFALVGRYKHSLWGVVSSHSFIAYERPSYGTDPDETVVLDSLVLSLAFDGRFVGDTTLQQTLSIYQLTEKIVLNDNGYLYNNSSVSYAPEALAVCSFKPKPKGGEKLEVRLPDALGQDLLSRFHAQDQAVSEERFEDYFKGVVIVPDLAGSESLLTFTVADSSAALVLHYHLSDELSTEKELWFFPNTDTQFNHIDHDRSGTDMAGLKRRRNRLP